MRNEKGYGGENRSDEALRSEDYRKRQRKAFCNQVLNKEIGNEKKDNIFESNYSEKIKSEVEDINIITKEELLKIRGKLDVNSKNTLHNMSASEYYNLYNNKEHKVLNLTLQLEMGYLSVEDKVILNRYGKVKKGITREILVPGNITLHALHYLIQRAFGWQNSHLHSFKLSNESFQRITGGKNETDRFGMVNYDGKLTNWIDLCGLYFRFPTEDYEDIYWDDDYKEGISFKTWLRKKYTGPYRYGGEWEKYHKANGAARNIIQQTKTIIVDDDIHNSKPIEITHNSYNITKKSIPITEATIEDFQYSFGESLDELLEKIPVANLLVPQGMVIDEEALKRMNEVCDKQRKSFDELMVMPITDEIIYEYDYGDGWQVSIKMSDCYYTKDSWTTMEESGIDSYFIPPIKEKDYIEDQRAYNLKDEYVGEEMSRKIATVAIKERPICIALDGLSVMDDVGGIHGYIDFLVENRLSVSPERDGIRKWANEMGWNGRMNKPDNLI